MSDQGSSSNPEPPGSPAYVRRLRDQAAVVSLEMMNPKEAVQDANALIAALGYQVPGEGDDRD